MTHDAYSTKRVTVWDDTCNGKPGKAIKYQDGYTSWCPDEVYARDYQPVDALSFGHALHALRGGHCVARADWSGNGMFLFLTSEGDFSHPIVDGYMPPYIVMKTAEIAPTDPNLVACDVPVLRPWLASQADVLANDWQILAA